MSEKKKILIFIDWFLPGYKAGGPIRSIANMIDRLSEFYDFSIITSNKDYLETDPYPNIESNKWLNYESKAKIIYLSDESLNKKSISKLISETEFNIAYINGMYSYFFSILPLRLLKKTGKKIIIAPRGMISDQAFSAKVFKKKLFLMIANLSSLYRRVDFHATSEQEVKDIKKQISHHTEIKYAPNLTREILSNGISKRSKKSGELKLISIARISPEKNTLFALEVLFSTNFNGNVQFDLYGSVYNSDYWESCQKIISSLPNNISIRYKNAVESQKVNDTFTDYHFAFMPSKGENFGHSLFEALSSGCPIITSDQTPWQNLEEKEIGWDIPLSDVDKFHSVIQKCIEMDQEEYNRLSENAFKFAQTYADKNDGINKTIKLFE